MPIRPIRLLGDPVLRKRCRKVASAQTDAVRTVVDNLRDTLHDFRDRHGFGRGIAAPQIGVLSRIIYVEPSIGGPLINPRIVWKSRSTFLMWDDCFSFPDLLVRLRRNESIVVEYLDGEGEKRTVNATGGLSELLQHEIDHLDGVLAVDRARSVRDIILRSERSRAERAETGEGITD